MKLPAKNQIIRDDEGREFRVLHINGKADEAYLIGLDDKSVLPFMTKWDGNQASSGKVKQRWTVSTTKTIRQAPRSTPAALALRDQRFEQIKGLVNNPNILLKAGRAKLIEDHIKKLVEERDSSKKRQEETKPSQQSIRTYLALWWKGGQVIDALTPTFENCGSSDDSKSEKNREVSRGRKPNARAGYSTPFLITPKIRKELTEKAIRIFKKEPLKGIAAIHLDILMEDYSRVDARGFKVIFSDGLHPSYQQLYNLIKTNVTLKDKIKRRSSQADHDSNRRAKLGTILNDCPGVGFYYEIDSTLVDLFLVSKINRKKVIGKATLYLIRDRYSRLLVGFHLTLDDPSWEGAMEAILTIFEDKRSLCERWGVEYIPEAWPAHGYMPISLVADRGPDVIAKTGDVLSTELQVNLVNPPPRKAEMKGTVEGGFQLTQKTIRDFVPGYDPPRFQGARQSEDYSLDALLNIDGLGKIILGDWQSRNLMPHPKIRLDPQDLMDGLKPIPAEIWNWDINRSQSGAGILDHDFVHRKLLPRRHAAVKNKGIYVNYCYYECETAIKQEWFTRASKKEWRVWVGVDRRSVDFIYVHHEDGRIEKAWLTPGSENLKGLSAREVAILEDIKKDNEAEAASLIKQMKAESAQRTKAIVDEARKAHAAIPVSHKPESRIDKDGVLREQEQKVRRINTTARLNSAGGKVVPLPVVPKSTPIVEVETRNQEAQPIETIVHDVKHNMSSMSKADIVKAMFKTGRSA